MKKQRKVEKDNRGVAIYARKSRITNKGDSIGVQFKQCADYAKKELGLDEEYEFLQYEDKGLSGYFSDRPDFQRMLHDVQDGKIKAIVCYKLDRVGRKIGPSWSEVRTTDRNGGNYLIAVIHRGQKFKETMEAFQQKRAEFIARGIRSFDTETLYVFLEWVRSNGHKLDRITGMAV